MILVVVVTSFVGNPQDEADKKALQSIVETNATGQALYRDLTHDFAHHAVFKRWGLKWVDFLFAFGPVESFDFIASLVNTAVKNSGTS